MAKIRLRRVTKDPVLEPGTKTGFGSRLKKYGKWKEATNVDRFVVLVFLTAAEKEAFSLKHFDGLNVDYVDGAEVTALTWMPAPDEPTPEQ